MLMFVVDPTRVVVVWSILRGDAQALPKPENRQTDVHACAQGQNTFCRPISAVRYRTQLHAQLATSCVRV